MFQITGDLPRTVNLLAHLSMNIAVLQEVKSIFADHSRSAVEEIKTALLMSVNTGGKQMKNQVFLYKQDQLEDQVLWSLTKACCLVFNQKHYMIHQRSEHVIGIEAVFKTKKVSHEDMYSHGALEPFLNEGYVFFHDPETVFKRLKAKFFRLGNRPYVSLLLDIHKKKYIGIQFYRFPD